MQSVPVKRVAHGVAHFSLRKVFGPKPLTNFSSKRVVFGITDMRDAVIVPFLLVFCGQPENSTNGVEQRPAGGNQRLDATGAQALTQLGEVPVPFFIQQRDVSGLFMTANKVVADRGVSANALNDRPGAIGVDATTFRGALKGQPPGIGRQRGFGQPLPARREHDLAPTSREILCQRLSGGRADDFPAWISSQQLGGPDNRVVKALGGTRWNGAGGAVVLLGACVDRQIKPVEGGGENLAVVERRLVVKIRQTLWPHVLDVAEYLRLRRHPLDGKRRSFFRCQHHSSRRQYDSRGIKFRVVVRQDVLDAHDALHQLPVDVHEKREDVALHNLYRGALRNVEKLRYGVDILHPLLLDRGVDVWVFHLVEVHSFTLSSSCALCSKLLDSSAKKL